MTIKNNRIGLFFLLILAANQSAAIRGESLQEVPAPVSVVNGAELDLSGYTNPDELLSALPQSTYTDPNADRTGATPDVTLRGLGSDRTLVLINGRRFPASTPTGAFNNLADDIERVEVISGGAAPIYGSDAISGVVNVVTRRPAPDFGWTRSPYGDTLSLLSQFSLSTQRMDQCNATQGGQFPLISQFKDLDMGTATTQFSDGSPGFFFGPKSSGFGEPSAEDLDRYGALDATTRAMARDITANAVVQFLASEQARDASGTITEQPVPKLAIEFRFNDSFQLTSPFGDMRDTETGAGEGAPRAFTNENGAAAFEIDDPFLQAFVGLGAEPSADTPEGDSTPTSATRGTVAPAEPDYDVTQFFTEADLPQYDASGGTGASGHGGWDIGLRADIGDSWKIGVKLNHEPVESYYQTFSDRAAFSESLRSPALAELFGPGSQGFLQDYESRLGDGLSLGGNYYQDFTVSENLDEQFQQAVTSLFPNQLGLSNNLCGDTAVMPEGLGYVAAATSAIKSVDDQWAFDRVNAPSSDITQLKPIIVALIDTGLDWHHLDISPDNLWRNTAEIPNNFKDDDDNGYIDDEFGWDFIEKDNRPWDFDGHGTFVAGIIAAAHGNAGIEGINPNAKLMILKALNGFGRSRAMTIARAIVYAADNGANIVNLSVSPSFPDVVQAAVDYAQEKDVLVITAAGNRAQNLDAMQPGGLRGVMTVAATDADDKRAGFSNLGSNVSVAAPGVDIVSLRARRTDFMYNNADTKYVPGDAFIGDDNRYYRSAGTSFATAITSAVASYVWSQRPTLSYSELHQILEQSARDVETPGRDRATGYGVIDADAALTADPAFYIKASIPGVRRIDRNGLAMLQVIGTADANGFGNARLEIGAGEAPEEWLPVPGALLLPVKLGELGKIPADMLVGQPTWTIRVVVTHENGEQREGRFIVDLG